MSDASETGISTFLRGIMLGDYDEELSNLTTAIRERKHYLTKINTASLNVGDEVRFADTIRPKYLAGMPATVVKINRESIVVECPDDPAFYGRFSGAKNVRCNRSLIAGAS